MQVTVTVTTPMAPPGASVYAKLSRVVPGGSLQYPAVGVYVRLRPSSAIATTPWAGAVREAMVMGPPSMSKSFASTVMVLAALSCATVAASSTATGASSTAVTVTVTVAVEPPLRVYVNVSVPEMLAFGA